MTATSTGVCKICRSEWSEPRTIENWCLRFMWFGHVNLETMPKSAWLLCDACLWALEGKFKCPTGRWRGKCSELHIIRFANLVLKELITYRRLGRPRRGISRDMDRLLTRALRGSPTDSPLRRPLHSSDRRSPGQSMGARPGV